MLRHCRMKGGKVSTQVHRVQCFIFIYLHHDTYSLPFLALWPFWDITSKKGFEGLLYSLLRYKGISPLHFTGVSSDFYSWANHWVFLVLGAKIEK